MTSSLQEVVDGSGMEQHGREYLIQVHKVFRVQQVAQDLQVLKALLVHKVLQVLKVLKVPKVIKVEGSDGVTYKQLVKGNDDVRLAVCDPNDAAQRWLGRGGSRPAAGLRR